MNTEQEWHGLYFSTILETNKAKMEERICEAESAIKARLQEFAANHGGTPDENRTIERALTALKVLRNEVAAWSEPKPS